MDIYKMKMTSGDDQSKKRLSMEAKPGRNLLSSLSSILQHHHHFTHDVRIKYIGGRAHMTYSGIGEGRVSPNDYSIT